MRGRLVSVGRVRYHLCLSFRFGNELTLSVFHECAGGCGEADVYLEQVNG